MQVYLSDCVFVKWTLAALQQNYAVQVGDLIVQRFQHSQSSPLPLSSLNMDTAAFHVLLIMQSSFHVLPGFHTLGFSSEGGGQEMKRKCRWSRRASIFVWNSKDQTDGLVAPQPLQAKGDLLQPCSQQVVVELYLQLKEKKKKKLSSSLFLFFK